MEVITNRKYAKSASFVAICERAGVKPTKRQASKFRNNRGTAYKFVH